MFYSSVLIWMAVDVLPREVRWVGVSSLYALRVAVLCHHSFLASCSFESRCTRIPLRILALALPPSPPPLSSYSIVSSVVLSRLSFSMHHDQYIIFNRLTRRRRRRRRRRRISHSSQEKQKISKRLPPPPSLRSIPIFKFSSCSVHLRLIKQTACAGRTLQAPRCI